MIKSRFASIHSLFVIRERIQEGESPNENISEFRIWNLRHRDCPNLSRQEHVELVVVFFSTPARAWWWRGARSLAAVGLNRQSAALQRRRNCRDDDDAGDEGLGAIGRTL